MPELDQYYTDPKLARRIVAWAGIEHGMRVLEPSAGNGSFVRSLPSGVCCLAVELDTDNVRDLRSIAVERATQLQLIVLQREFLSLQHPPKLPPYDIATMNPPYGSRGSDVPPDADGRHVAHALSMSQRVVALVRSTFFYSTARYEHVWRQAALTRVAHLKNRPKFFGPSDKGFTARHDFCVVELVRLPERRQPGHIDNVQVEIWT